MSLLFWQHFDSIDHATCTYLQPAGFRNWSTEPEACVTWHSFEVNVALRSYSIKVLNVNYSVCACYMYASKKTIMARWSSKVELTNQIHVHNIIGLSRLHSLLT